MSRKVSSEHAPKSDIVSNLRCSGDIMKTQGSCYRVLVNSSWFHSIQYADPYRTMRVTISSHFLMDWHTLSYFNIAKSKYQINLGIQESNKRNPVYDKNNIFVDTKPLRMYKSDWYSKGC